MNSRIPMTVSLALAPTDKLMLVSLDEERLILELRAQADRKAISISQSEGKLLRRIRSQKSPGMFLMHVGGDGKIKALSVLPTLLEVM